MKKILVIFGVLAVMALALTGCTKKTGTTTTKTSTETPPPPPADSAIPQDTPE